MKTNFDELNDRLDELAKRRERLADHLESVADRLSDHGERPPNQLLTDLKKYRTEFSSLASELGLIDTHDADDTGELSLGVLRRQLDWSRRIDTSLKILERVRRLRHRDGSVPGELHAVFDDAGIIRERLESWPDVDPQVVDELSAGTHPLAQLVQLTDNSGQLTDQQWHEFVENLCDAYGREVSVIAARGRLTFELNEKEDFG